MKAIVHVQDAINITRIRRTHVKLTVENGRLSAWNHIISAHFHLPITPSGLVFWQGSVDAKRLRCHETSAQWQPHRVGLSKTRRFTSKGRFTLLREHAKSNVKTEKKFKKHGFVEDSATKQHRLTHPDSLISAPLSNYHLWSEKFSYKTILILL